MTRVKKKKKKLGVRRGVDLRGVDEARQSRQEDGYLPKGRKVDIRLPGKGNSNSHGARPVHQTISTIKWIRTCAPPESAPPHTPDGVEQLAETEASNAATSKAAETTPALDASGWSETLPVE